MCATRSWSPAIRWTMARSPPAENALPAPVTTATFVSGSAETSAQTRASSPCIGSLAAWYWAGRFMVTSSTPLSRRSKVRCSYSENFTVLPAGLRMGVGGSAHREAAADADGLAGDEGGLVRGEERDDAGDVVRLAEPPERYRPGQGLAQLRSRELGEQRGVSRAGAHAVDPDLVPCHLPGQRLGEGDHAALGGGVDRLARGSDPARVRTQVHHGPGALAGHHRHHCLAGVQDAVQVDPDGAIPVGRVGVGEGAGLVPP